MLARTGVRLDEPEAVELVRRAGATVDGDIVRLPAKLVEDALAAAPREFTIYDREGRPALTLDGSRTYFGPGSDCLHIVDHRSGERRAPVLQDVLEGVTLCDALEHIDFAMSLFLPADVPQQTADRHQMRVMLNATTKPLIFVTYDMSGCVDDIAMAEAVAGGPAALAERPFLACYINTASGLLHNRDSLEKLLYLAGKGVPVLYIPGSIAGLSGPATVAGSVAMINAGVLAGLVIAQLKHEGRRSSSKDGAEAVWTCAPWSTAMPAQTPAAPPRPWVRTTTCPRSPWRAPATPRSSTSKQVRRWRSRSWLTLSPASTSSTTWAISNRA